MRKNFFAIGFALGLLSCFLIAPQAFSAGICTCMGDVSVNFGGKAAASLANVDLAGMCSSNGGKFDGSTCSNLEKRIPASSKAECDGMDEKTLIRNFNLPSAVSSMGSITIYCAWEETAGVTPDKNATGTLAAPSAPASAGTGGVGNGPNTTVNLENPIAGSADMLGVYGNIIKAALGLVGSLTLLMLVWGGFQWLTSAGNAEKVKKGTQTMIWAAIGAFLVLASYLIMTTFLYYLTSAPK